MTIFDQRDGTLVFSALEHERRAQVLGLARTRGPYERFFKAVIDRIGALLVTLVALPLTIIIAFFVLVRIGRPILYREERVGKNGRVFKMNRFRTMALATSATEDFESRISPAGRFLRRWSLDELPQLWNVMIGDMSLVGPRPERTTRVHSYEPWQYRRFQVRPGVTGLWQISARGDGRHMHEHVEIDLQYVDHISLVGDLRILASTIGVVSRCPENPSVIPGVTDTLELRKLTLRDMGYLSFKRLADIAISVSLLVILSPIWATVALAIKIDSPGPVFFRQTRVGRHGQLFRVVKFRTMTHGASEEPHRNHCVELATAKHESALKLDIDPRVTKIGVRLRGWSLDELPNLWNVLRGEMSLVGPRPIVPYELDLYSAEHMRRLDAKPGITGMAQIHGRDDISLEDRVAFDLAYLDQRTFWFDMRMLARTMPAVLFTRGK